MFFRQNTYISNFFPVLKFIPFKLFDTRTNTGWNDTLGWEEKIERKLSVTQSEFELTSVLKEAEKRFVRYA